MLAAKGRLAPSFAYSITFSRIRAILSHRRDPFTYYAAYEFFLKLLIMQRMSFEKCANCVMKAGLYAK
jgi:hypothetical protein